MSGKSVMAVGADFDLDNDTIDRMTERLVVYIEIGHSEESLDPRWLSTEVNECCLSWAMADNVIAHVLIREVLVQPIID